MFVSSLRRYVVRFACGTRVRTPWRTLRACTHEPACAHVPACVHVHMQVGPVAEVALIRDKSGRSKGLAYVEFKELQGVSMSLLLNGQKFCMQHPVRCCRCSAVVSAREQ